MPSARYCAILAFTLVLAACGQSQHAPGPSPSPAPAQTKRTHQHVAVPAASSTSVPTSSPTPVVLWSAQPAAVRTATPAPSVHVRTVARPEPPRIYSIVVNTASAGNGDVVQGTVHTNATVVGVRVQIASIHVDLAKAGPGNFTMRTTLAGIPFFIRGTFPVSVIARDAAGRTAQRVVSFTVR
ncbi:MAG: hypothetical protein JO199_06390 [Candidatus Eremiobacteraeota bacterium]|nr:hypothetical protein [Candidatus Eremiobacteraeota bacterium]